MARQIITLEEFAKLIYDLLKSDRDVNVGIGGFTGEGKCWGRGTEILMYDGSLKKVEDIKINELVMGVDSEPKKVTNTHHGFSPMYKIIQIKGLPYVVNENHILTLKRTRLTNGYFDKSRNKFRTFKDRKGEICNITIKDYLNTTKAFKHFYKGYKKQINFKHNTDIKIPPYLLGLWLGDGTSRNTQFTSMDQEVIQYLKDIALQFGCHITFGQNKGKVLSISLVNKIFEKNKLRELFREYGVFMNKHIPIQYKINSREVQLELLAGLIDTDGYVNHQGYVFVNKNKSMAEDVCFIARSLGLYSYISKYTNKQFNIDYYKVGISGDCSIIPVRIQRKKVAKRKQKKDVLVTGFKVEPIGYGEYHGFTLEGDGLCLLSDFTVNHNSTMASKLQQAYAKVSGTHWDFSHMTWSRKELMEWIDGQPKSAKDANGLRVNQKPEFTAILPDELFLMFYRRNWYQDSQVDAIGTFNMCRDRHLFLCGNVPSFWDLDGAFTSRLRFYLYIPFRGVAWLFEQENNPFASDPWNPNENKKIFRKHKKPDKIPNFIGEIHFPDWTDKEKEEYYQIRNDKRIKAVADDRDTRTERYGRVKEQRDKLIRLIHNQIPDITYDDLAEMLDLSKKMIQIILGNESK